MTLQEFKEEKLKEFDEKFVVNLDTDKKGKPCHFVLLQMPKLNDLYNAYKKFISDSLDSQVALIKENLPKEKEVHNQDQVGKVGTWAIASNQAFGFNAARKEIINYLEE